MKLKKSKRVYNFRVNGYHNYFVTDLKIWTHNCGGFPGGAGGGGGGYRAGGGGSFSTDLPLFRPSTIYRHFKAPDVKLPKPKASVNKGNLTAKVEVNAGKQLVKMESGTPKAHYYLRHAAQTTLNQQYTRATTGATPDGFAGRKVDSSRFLSNQIQLNAAQRAETIYNQTGKSSFTFDARGIIGEGYKKGGGNLVQTTHVTAVFRNGKLYTMYPSLSH
ncbi:hypothetical protein [Paenibacillus agilis]|uniref:hypothetical protein n=1 Tax=Paenibacillus agilis TaxID=3020863 RepID=UPI0021BD4ACE|nr:hypothetical protein [Paenibacillus agilis]